jgi:xanthine dehydrogenase YagS FAD-binding subunit
MAVIRDVMPPFELFQPASTDAAVALLDQHGSDAWVLGGGLDSLDWFKDRVKRPKVVVSLSGIDELKQIRQTDDGLELGSMATLIDVINHSEVRANFPTLSEAAHAAASPQIRNQGTIGGNVSQDTRCWYYRDGWSCYRAGGNICYASPPTAMNREHCILGASRCVAVNPSDTAPVFVALDAKMVIRRGSSERVVDAEDYFIGPEIDIMRMTVMEAGDLLAAIRIPPTWAGTRLYFEKVRDRGSWDFPLVNIASAMVESDGVVERARVVVNGVAPYPVRLTAVEDVLSGQTLSEELAEHAGQVAVRGVEPLTHNGFKVPLMTNLVKRAVRGGPST